MNIFKRMARFFISRFYPPLKPFLRPFKSNQGVKVAILSKNKLLLIKNTYREGWTLPGGGVRKNESPEHAAIREVCEELGISIGNLKTHGSAKLDFERDGIVTMFSCRVNKPDYIVDNLEVEKAKWVDFSEISKIELLPMAKKCIQLLL